MYIFSSFMVPPARGAWVIATKITCNSSGSLSWPQARAGIQIMDSGLRQNDKSWPVARTGLVARSIFIFCGAGCNQHGGFPRKQEFGGKLEMDHIKVLKDLISLDTSVPPGLNYERAIDYLEPLFRQVGLETQKISIPREYVYGKKDSAHSNYSSSG